MNVHAIISANSSFDKTLQGIAEGLRTNGIGPSGKVLMYVPKSSSSTAIFPLPACKICQAISPLKIDRYRQPFYRAIKTV